MVEVSSFVPARDHGVAESDEPLSELDIDSAEKDSSLGEAS